MRCEDFVLQIDTQSRDRYFIKVLKSPTKRPFTRWWATSAAALGLILALALGADWPPFAQPALDVDLALPENAAPPSPPSAVTASWVQQDGEQEVASNVAGLKAKLTTIDRLANGRLRWRFELINTTDSPLEIGFDARQTYLSDNHGNSYRVLATDFNPNADATQSIYRGTLQPGVLAQHWFEFSGPIDGAHRFIAVLTSHDTEKLRFFPLTTSLD